LIRKAGQKNVLEKRLGVRLNEDFFPEHFFHVLKNALHAFPPLVPIMSESGRFSKYNTSQIKAILVYHIQRNRTRTSLPMCIRKGKHGRAESQRFMYEELMNSPSFSGLKDIERPALEPFGDKVKYFTDLAKILFKMKRPFDFGVPHGPTNAAGFLLSGFGAIRSDESLVREAALMYLEPHLKVGIQLAVWMWSRLFLGYQKPN
jgi:hypothetical protein